MRKELSSEAMKFFGFCLNFGLLGCYSLKQASTFLRIYSRGEPLSDLLKDQNLEPDQKRGLEFVQRLKVLAQDWIGLKTESSYEKVIFWPQGEPLTHLIFASSSRTFALKTWWFPIIGSQPYLGFFDKKDALKTKRLLEEEDFEVYVGGASAFSLLGYFDDPFFTSFWDSVHPYRTVELLLHEWTHRTFYLPDHTEFNENVARFVERKGTAYLCERFSDLCGLDRKAYERMQNKKEKFYKDYLAFLPKVLKKTKALFSKSKSFSDSFWKRKKENHYQKVGMLANEVLKGNPYVRVFENLNTPKLLSLGTYEGHFQELDAFFLAAGGDFKEFFKHLDLCLKGQKFVSIWSQLKKCRREIP